MIKNAVGCFILFISWLPSRAVLKNGIWQARILRTDGQQIVFNFKSKDSAGKKIIYIMNGKERLLVDDIKTVGDSVFIQMPFFNARFALRINADGNLSGNYIKDYGSRILTLPFTALYDHPERFPVSNPPLVNVSGRWWVHFKEKNDTGYNAVGEFLQNGHSVTGTFLTSTGDYRYLQGVVDGDSLKLSAFDGGHAYLFTARIQTDSMTGAFYAGASGLESWIATRNEKAALPDEYSLTKLKTGQTKLSFHFKNMDGKMISINDPAYKNKVVIVQIMGSWCPNCMDETRFLSSYYNQHKSEGLSVIGLAYERTTDFATSKKSLSSFIRRFEVSYPVLITGITVSDSLRTEKTLPQLDNINAFPTTIFIDKKGEVRKIHTGFDGPGTGTHYETFKKEFDAIVQGLLKQ